MLINSLELENIKSYKAIKIDFQPGTTAISGLNGAGKTTLVEAIGFALFDSMYYKQDQFVREGEKFGRVVVRLTGNDGRPYVVERRCGSGALWTLHDIEADYRLEQRADVQDKLHELFGIERERSLENLFRDALGVPQGTFTSIFLQAPRLRKQTFDALLQIEDYNTAFSYLLDAQKQYKEQALTQEREIQRLSFETRDLEAWRLALEAARADDQVLKTNNALCSRRLTEQKATFLQLQQRQEELQNCASALQRGRFEADKAHQRYTQAVTALEEARTAHQMVEANYPEHERYLQAVKRLTELRLDERERNTLQRELAGHTNTQATTRANIQNLQEHLARIAQAHQRILDLIPAVEKQSELHQHIGTLRQQVQQYQYLMQEGNRILESRGKYQQELSQAQSQIAEIEPLRPLAEQLDERKARVLQLEEQSRQRASRQSQLQSRQRVLEEKRADLVQTQNRLRNAEEGIRKIEERRSEAEEYVTLQEQSRQLALRQHHLMGNIESYGDSLERSADGQCPLLHQACLNVRQQGQVSLQTYFTELLEEEQKQLNEIVAQLARLDERQQAIKKYAEALAKLDQYIERRDTYAERVESLQAELTLLEREVQTLQDECAQLDRVDQEIQQARQAREESQKADKQVRLLDGLTIQVEQLQEHLNQLQSEFEARRSEARPFKQSREQLQLREQELEELNNPIAQSKGLQEIIKPEATLQQQLQAAQERLEKVTQEINGLTARLEGYSHLDRSISEQEVTRDRAEQGHQLYLKNIELAGRLPERERDWQQAHAFLAQAQEALSVAEKAYQRAEQAFDPVEFQAIAGDISNLEQEIARLANQMERLQQDINLLAERITGAEALLIELENAQKERQTLEELTTMMEQFRKLLKEAAPYVLRAILNDVSAEANRIFGEIMGDRSAQLTWSDDYEITVQRQGSKRAFAQLSGGEQMSAALAVRLALLKKLSTLNIAFFDEPTQNMDEQRRTNLADQIQRVRGFDQLIVISHDDTFEQSLDSLIRLQKRDGQTRLRSEEDDLSLATPISEQVNAYAS